MDRDKTIWKEPRSPKMRSHQFRKAPINKAPKNVMEKLVCEHGSLSSYDPPDHCCQKYVARKGKSCSMVVGCQKVSCNEQGRSSKRGFAKVTIEMSEMEETHSRPSDCQTFSLSSVELHRRDVVT